MLGGNSQNKPDGFSIHVVLRSGAEIFKVTMHLLVTLFYGIYSQRAFRYLQMAADAGNSNAMAYLGKVHYSLSNLVKSLVLELKLYFLNLLIFYMKRLMAGTCFC